MKEATHTRKGKIIIALDTGAVEDHKSVNAAKKASHKLQPAGLGRGLVRRTPSNEADRRKRYQGAQRR